jgi:regulator of sigma E protease
MLTQHIYGYLLDVLSFVIVLGIAVLIHEAGHFIVARLSGIRVEKFSIGFGKAIFSFKRGDTEYILAPIPMGGYVKLAGDNPAETTGKDDEFYSVSPWRRIPTVIAGPAANILGAFTIFFALAYLYGANYNYNIIGTVVPGSLEDQAGLKKNDEIVSVDGVPVSTWGEYIDGLEAAQKAQKKQVALEIRRTGENLKVTLPTDEETADRCLVLADCDPVGPGAEVGLQPGDRVIEIAGTKPQTWSEFRKIAQALWDDTGDGPKGRTVSLRWQTATGEIRSASITPAVVKNEAGEKQAQLGVIPAILEFGMSPLVPPKVESTSRGFPAAEAGIPPGAEIISVNGQLMDNADDVERVVTYSFKIPPGETGEKAVPVPLEVVWKSPGDSQIHATTLVPRVEMSPNRSEIGLQLAREFPLARIGVTFAQPTRPLGLVESLGKGFSGTIDACVETWFVLKGLATGKVNRKLIGGPVAILQLSARVGKEGMRRLFWFCAFLQANLALLNLLPIPVLDGGHLVVALCEGVSRRTFSLRTREVIQYVGLAILLPLFFFVFYNDFDRIGLFKWIKELVS